MPDYPDEYTDFQGAKPGAPYLLVIHPETTGFKLSVFAKLLDLEQRASWYLLSKRLNIAYRVELNKLSTAIGRAEWLASTL